MNKEDLIQFETDIKDEFLQAKIKAPIHLSDGNEDQLIRIFQKIGRNDWVFSTWRNHYHALLHGIDPVWLKEQIMMGRSMSIKLFRSKVSHIRNCRINTIHSGWSSSRPQKEGGLRNGVVFCWRHG